MKTLSLVNQRWFQILVIGVLLFFGAEQALVLTGNLNFIPTVILLGAFVVPATFSTYFYSQERALDGTRHAEVPFSLVVTCFLVGGVVGSVLAGFLEFETVRSAAISNLFGIALIEEAAKLILPVIILLRGRYRSEADGLLFGVTCGMGFAALETMGYGLVALINSQGNVGNLEQTLLIRGLVSPLGHAAWTGIVCAVLWRQWRKPGKFGISVIVGVFALTVSLHAVWDIVSSSNQMAVVYLGYAAVGTVSLILLISRLRDARRLSLAEQTATIPDSH